MRFLCRLPTLSGRLRFFFRHGWTQFRIRMRKRGDGTPISQDSPVFIVGCGHSGTTLMISILHAHPDLYAVPGETDIFDPRRSRKAIGGWYERQKAEAGPGRRVVEKTPKNVRFLARAFRLFPNCRVVVVTRDGRDVVCSLRKRTGRFPGAVVRWLYDTGQGMAWAERDQVLSIRYEDLVADFEGTLTRVCVFLGLGFHPDLWSFHEAGYDNRGPKRRTTVTEHSRLRTAQARAPLFDARGKWRECLSDWEICVLMAVARTRMEQLGYLGPQSRQRD